MDLSMFLDLGLILAIIALVQTWKRMWFNADIEKPKNFWITVVVIAGIPAYCIAAGQNGFEEWKGIWAGEGVLLLKLLQQFFVVLKGIIIYSGGAALIYQTGKARIPWLNVLNNEKSSEIG